MDDIILAIPWSCDDKDCPSQWHLGNYWAYGDGTYSYDAYSDGDHEDVDRDEVPEYEEVSKAWREYMQHVVATGEDPLGEIMLPSREIKERWTFRYRRSILGIVMMAKRNRGEWMSGKQAPPHVREYGRADEKGIVTEFGPWGEFVAALPEGLRQINQHTVQGDYTLTRTGVIKDPAAYRRKVARKSLREKP
jgi:hypothetical protein